jgi:DnaJ-class molecular chaperone
MFCDVKKKSKPANSRSKNLTVAITLTPEQAFQGGRINVTVPLEQTCPSCSGRGWAGGYECRRCNGEGLFSGEYPVMIRYPSGITDHHLVRLPLDHHGIQNFYLTVHFFVSEMI